MPDHTALPPVLDCLVIGGGPAGLTAATYLARFHRDILVADDGNSRARWIPASHNCPGFPFGVAGNELLARFRTHAEEYGVPVATTRIRQLTRRDRCFIASDGQREWRARTVILATGVVDRLPDIAGIEDAIAQGTIRLCAVCDAYEAGDDAIGVLAPAEVAVGHAEFLRTFSSRVCVIRSDGGGPLDEDLRARAEAAGIDVCEARQLSVVGTACQVQLPDGGTRRFDTVYPVLGADNQSQLASTLGARVDAEGALEVDDHLQTTVDGLYAVGDVVSALNQIAVAVGHAAIAATAVHRRLPVNRR